MSRNTKRFTVIFLILCYVFSSVGFSFASEPNAKHWADETLQKWVELNLLKGDANGELNPDNPITRAEFVAFVNRVFNFTNDKSRVFPDVSSNKWYAADISKAYNAGILSGDEKGNMNPEANITRQEAAAILSRVFKLKALDRKAYESFIDSKEISKWAQEAVSAMKEKGYLKGKGNNNFAPTDRATRAEAVVMINNAMGRLINKAGTYSGDSNGNVVVSVRDVNLENMNIGDSLYLTPGIGEGDVNVKNAKVAGNIYADGGGVNSIKINDSTVNGKLIVNKSKVRVVIGSNSSIEEIEITEDGTGATIIIEEGSTISNIIINGAVTLEVTGNIGRIDINVDGVIIKGKPENIVLGEGLKANIDGIEVIGGKNGEIIYPQTPTPPTQPIEPSVENLNIVKDGESSFSIVIPDDATKVEETAADELKQYIKKATGAELSIVNESDAGEKAIMIGATRFAQANNVVAEGEEDWIIKGFNNKLVLTGGETRGVLYSVYHFLEDIVGVRWWNQWEEYVPSSSTIQISAVLDIRGKPAFSYRKIYEGIKGSTLFYVHNRLNAAQSTASTYGGLEGYGPPAGSNTFDDYLPPSQYFADHPKYFAMVNGKRVSNGQLCLTNPEVKSIILDKLKSNIATSYAQADASGLPRPTYFSISQNANQLKCECPDCAAETALRGDSGLMVNFVNEIADLIKDEYPQVMLETMAHQYTFEPPIDGIRPRDNVAILFQPIYADALHDMLHPNNAEFLAALEGWSELCDNDNLKVLYYSLNTGNAAPMQTMFRVGEDYKLFRDYGVRGIYDSHANMFSSDMWDMVEWIEAKLMEDPYEDIDALIQDFTDGYYGSEAGELIRQYLYLVKAEVENSDQSAIWNTNICDLKLLSPETVLNANELFEQALIAVEGNPVHTMRVNMARNSLDRYIVLEYGYLNSEANEQGLSFNLSKNEAATRLVNSYSAIKSQRVENGTGAKYTMTAIEKEQEAYYLEISNKVSGDPGIIVADGEAQYVIAIPDQAMTPSAAQDKVEKTAALELQTYIQKITGATLSIVKESELAPEDNAIMVGHTAFARNNGIEPDGEEEWEIRNIGNKLVITGNGKRGALYGVFHFLEDELGVRWWNQWEEYVPTYSTITVSDSLNKSGEPAFTTRRIYEKITGASLFYVHNRVNSSGSTSAAYGGVDTYGPPTSAHTFSYYIPESEYFAKQPEYFALVDGERAKSAQLCLTNPDVKDIIINKLKNYIETAYAQADANGTDRPVYFVLEQNDNARSCQCPECSAAVNQRGESGVILNFVNEIADEIKDEYPDVLLETLAYTYTFEPPKDDTKPRDNVVVMYAPIYGDLLHSMSHPNNASDLDALYRWSEICTNNNLKIWYYSLNVGCTAPMQYVYRIAEEFRLFHELGASGFMIEHETMLNGDMWDMVEWMQVKLMEDPYQDIDALIRDFTDGYYGPEAGELIRQYLDLVAEDLESSNAFGRWNTNICALRYLNADTVLSANTLLEQALKAVAGDPVYTMRVNTARNSLDRYIVMEYSFLKDQAAELGIPFELSKVEAATRLLDSYAAIRSERIENTVGPKYVPFSQELIHEQYFKEVVKGAFNEDCVAEKVANTVTIDGILDEAEWKLDSDVGVKLNAPLATAKIGHLWDDENLYIGFDITDSDVCSSLLNDSWFNDGVEIFIDGDLVQGVYNEHTAQIMFRWNDDKVYTYGNNNVKTDIILHKMVKTDNGYTVEIAIPWSSIGINVHAGKTIGFTCHVNDSRTVNGAIKLVGVLGYTYSISNGDSLNSSGWSKLQLITSDATPPGFQP